MKKKIPLALAAAALFLACGNNSKHIHTLAPADFSATLEQHQIPLIDVRTAKEYAEGHLPGAVNIDVKQASFAEQALVLGDTVAVYCLRGSRSMKAATMLAKEGKEVYNLAGGITAWKNDGRATTTK